MGVPTPVTDRVCGSEEGPGSMKAELGRGGGVGPSPRWRAVPSLDVKSACSGGLFCGLERGIRVLCSVIGKKKCACHKNAFTSLFFICA